ncbi:MULTISPECIES: hypothetical protein [unclassified Mesorhizobium]|uniref:hypothetical protein n=1 Tax=unclassified Mesorhizobium TaxID=325217 RepID=UPI00112D6AB8|nr:MULTISPECIES: hypothetical protein [unclassified Mesorhizobium]TPJ51637.1 hypothetical protein FJ426_20610 [Mesorhizobium sp. B2-6-4]TPN42315.1 hypothetical protein FJ979_01890 [Mesorhizobium sp. B1-1-6]
MDTISVEQREAMRQAFREENRRSFELEQVHLAGRLERQEIQQFSKAATSGQGNRAQRRRMQAELKKMMRKR